MGHLLSQIGITKGKAAQFKKKKIETVEDLLNFFPRRYQDFRNPVPVTELKDGMVQVVHGKVISMVGGTPILVQIEDVISGYRMDIPFFGSAWILGRIQVGEEWYFGGKISEYRFIPQMVNPTYVSKHPGKIMPVYPKIQGMSDEYLQKAIQSAITFLRKSHSFTQEDQQAKAVGLVDRITAYQQMHNPSSVESYKKAKMRIDFDRMYSFYQDMRSRNGSCQIHPEAITTTADTDKMLAALPFALTNGQKTAIAAIKASACNGQRLNAIVSGDVGCGKTLVAIAAASLMAENHRQTAMMAPTLVLAKQHYKEFCERLPNRTIALMTSETRKKERQKILDGIADGSVDILIGTHSILSPDLKFKQLGFTIVDEEHKFGVQQKETLLNMNQLGAHHLNMTATPIPRSYASAVYGTELEVLAIPDMPAGRKETITRYVSCAETAFDAIYEEVQKGHQAYLVTPFIEKSESAKFADVASVAEMKQNAERYYAQKNLSVRVACISGDMKAKAITETVDAFSAGMYDLLISTTIVEVGVNIPNATVIVIMNADRFGLAALHQLRGRVGRKGDQGYCYLVSKRDTDRLCILCHCHDGFEIAAKDMNLRGPGDLAGIEQSGTQSIQAIETILKRPKMAEQVRKFVFQ